MLVSFDILNNFGFICITFKVSSKPVCRQCNPYSEVEIINYSFYQFSPISLCWCWVSYYFCGKKFRRSSINFKNAGTQCLIFRNFSLCVKNKNPMPTVCLHYLKYYIFCSLENLTQILFRGTVYTYVLNKIYRFSFS